MSFVVFTEAILYVCFALLTGGLIITALPKKMLPPIHLPKKLMLACIIGIVILAFAPLLSIIIDFSDDIGTWLAIKGVIFSFEIGKAWLFMIAIALMLYGLVYFNDLKNDPFLSKVAVFLTVLLICGYTKGGHAASLQPILGFVYHSLHFISISVWAGLLLIVGWFSKSKERWLSFLKWFTPVAIISIIIAIVSGILTMTVDISNPAGDSLTILEKYPNTWVVDYGQALLLKHILIIPLITYAALNGFYIKRQLLKNENFNPIKWARVESIVALLIFCVTAFMGQQYPPHQIEGLLKTMGPSPPFEALFQGQIYPTMVVHFSFGSLSWILLGLGLLFIALIALSVIRSASGVVSFILMVGFVVSIYMCLILGIQS